MTLWRSGCAIAILCLTSGCAVASGESDAMSLQAPLPMPATALDEAALVRSALTYRSSNYVGISDVYPSAAVQSARIRVYVSKAAASAYGAIQPSITGSGAALPEGGVVVRELIDKAGKVIKLTLLAQGPKGYNPASGDLWFASTDTAGAFLVENGTSIHRPVRSCSGCYTARAQDGFLFGVAQSDRASQRL
jgi:hypothetical protein